MLNLGAMDVATRISIRIGPPLPHVFISYSREQRAYVRQLADHLREAADVEAWFDYEIVTGERWDKVVRTKIDECVALILVMTPDAEDSHWVAEEVAWARSRDKELLPLLLEGSPIFGFRTVHYEDVRGGGMPGDRFLRQLNEAVGRRPLPPAEPAQSPDPPQSPDVPRRRPREVPRRQMPTSRRRFEPPNRFEVLRLAFGLITLIGAVALLASPVGNVVRSLVISFEASGQSTSSEPSTTTSSTTTSSSAAVSPTSAVPGRTVRLSCYNNSTISGLVARACDDAKSLGWTIAERANYGSGTIPTTTVYYRSDPEEEASARELAALLHTRVEPRFAGIEGAPAGLIMIVTNDYQGPSRTS